MAFKGVTFAGQNVTPKDDGALYNAHYGDGIIDGCSMALSGDDLVIQSGHFIASGRVCHVDGATNVDLSTRTLTNGYIQVVLDFDMSKPEGMQWNPHTPLIESATTTFPALTQDDINGTGTLYQLELAVVQISGGNLTSIVSSMGISSLELRGDANKNPALNMTDGTSMSGVAYRSNGGFTTFGQWEKDVGVTNGMRLYDSGEVRIFSSDNAGIRFLPKGVADLTNQVAIDTNGDLHITAGQIHGGVKIGQYIKNTATSITSGGSWTQIMNTGTVLDATGIYIVFIYLEYKPNSSIAHPPWFRVNGTTYQTFYSSGNSSLHVDMMRVVAGVTSVTVEVVPQNVNINNASVSAGCFINYYRIA